MASVPSLLSAKFENQISLNEVLEVENSIHRSTTVKIFLAMEFEKGFPFNNNVCRNTSKTFKNKEIATSFVYANY